MASAIKLLAALLLFSISAQADTEILYYPTNDPKGPPRSRPREYQTWVDIGGIAFRPIGSKRRDIEDASDYIGNRLKDDLIAFLQSPEWHAIRESVGAAWGPLAKIPEEKLIEEIRASPFTVERRCKDDGKSRKEGVAVIGDRGGEVCFSAKKFIDANGDFDHLSRKIYLFGLAIHEILHHFGYWDADHRIFNAFSDAARRYFRFYLPPVSKVAVSDLFHAWREEMRYGTAPSLREDGKLTLTNCRMELVTSPDGRISAMSPVANRTALPVLREFFAGTLRISNSELDPHFFRIESSVKEADSSPVPQLLRPLPAPNENTWFLQPFAFSDPLKIASIARQAENGDVLFEITVLADDPAEVRLPSVIAFSDDPKIAGYVRCVSDLPHR